MLIKYENKITVPTMDFPKVLFHASYHIQRDIKFLIMLEYEVKFQNHHLSLSLLLYIKAIVKNSIGK